MMMNAGIVLGGLLILASSQKLTTEEVEPTPDDEDYSSMDSFLTQLEQQSGLSSLESNWIVPGINCYDYTECTINPNGTILWEVRNELYTQHLMHGIEDEEAKKTTLNGCLKYNPTDIDAYRECMEDVRISMSVFLITQFNGQFRNLLNANCDLVFENCINTTV